MATTSFRTVFALSVMALVGALGGESRTVLNNDDRQTNDEGGNTTNAVYYYAPGNNVRRRLGGGDAMLASSIPYIDCQVKTVSFMMDDRDFLEFRCVTYADQEVDHHTHMAYELPEWIASELETRLVDNDEITEFIRIFGARIHREEAPSSSNSNLRATRSGSSSRSPHDRIICDSDASFIVTDTTLHHSSTRHRHRQLATPKSGVNTILVARVSTHDAHVSLDAATLSNRIFGNQPGTVKSIYEDCSSNKLSFAPATTPNNNIIKGGVAEISISTLSMKGNKVSDYENTIMDAIQANVGDISQFQHVMICVPPGTLSRHGSTSWRAYAYVNSALSFYNDDLCGTLVTVTHELGHNLGLGHSGEGSDQYGDDSGLMGSIRGPGTQDPFQPRVCFNGAKNFQMGWFNDKSLTLRLNDFGAWKGRLYGITDYANSGGGHHVLLKVGDLYIQYNKITHINEGSQEKRDVVAVTQSSLRTASTSWSLAGLRAGDSHSVKNFSGSKALIIENCGFHDEGGGVGYYDLLIRYDTHNDSTTASCMSEPTGPYPAPTLPPTRAPPTLWPTPTPTKWPTPAPTPAPTKPPKAAIMDDTSSPSVAPTIAVSSMPTRSSAPSSIPSDMPSAMLSEGPTSDDKCDDNKDARFSFSNGTHVFRERCVWLASRPEMQKRLCHANETAYHVCEETCGKCVDTCQDSGGTFEHLGIQRDCAWLNLRTGVQNVVCQIGHESNATIVCPETCDVCD